MTVTSVLQLHVAAPRVLSRVLARAAKTGIYLVRGTTLSAVLVHALRDYAAGSWTPRRDAP